MVSPSRLITLSLFVSLLSLSPNLVAANAATQPPAPSGDLNVVGVVTADGERVESGRTFFSGEAIETARDALSTVSMGKLGRVEVLAESAVVISLTEAGVNVALKAGRVHISAPAGVPTRVITAWGEVLTDPAQASLFGVDVREGTAVVSVQLGQAELHAKRESRQVGAGESASSDYGDAGTQSGGGQGLSGGKKKGLLLALAGVVAAVVVFALTGKDVNTGAVPPCNGPIILSPGAGNPCG